MNVYTSRLKVVASQLGMKRRARFVSTQSDPKETIVSPLIDHSHESICITYIQSEHTRVCWFISLFLLHRSTLPSTHSYSKLLSSLFLPLQSPCEDCSVGVMFWVRLLFFLSRFQPIAQQNVLLRNPEFQQTKLLALLGIQRQQQRHCALCCRRKHNKRQTRHNLTNASIGMD